MPLNGAEDVKVGSWLFTGFMGAVVARGIRMVVSKVCVETELRGRRGGMGWGERAV